MRRKKRKNRLVLFIVELIVLAFLLGGLFVSAKLNKINQTNVNTDDIEKAEVDEATQAILSGYTNIAMFGLDNRSSGTYSTGNSDVIMVMSINNDTKEVRMASIYRDTMLDVSGKDEDVTYQKANSAYARGGAVQAMGMLNKNLDLSVEKYVSFDFKSVADAIDLLGGVEVEISDAEVEYMELYIENTNEILGTNAEQITAAGTYNLSGVQAVAYSRIRYTKGGDYKRAERQRLVLSKMMAKMKQAKLKTLNTMIDKILPNIDTNLSQAEILALAKAVMGYDMGNSSGFPFHRATKTIGSKGSLVVPCDLSSNVSQLHKFLFDTQDYAPSELVEAYNRDIIRMSGKDANSAEDDDFTNGDDFNGTKAEGNVSEAAE